MMSYPVNSYSQAPPQSFGQYGNGYPQQQRGFDQW